MVSFPSAAVGEPQAVNRQVLKCYVEGRSHTCEAEQLRALVEEAGTVPSRIEIGNGADVELSETLVIPKGADIEFVNTLRLPFGDSRIIRADGSFTGSLIRVEKGAKLTLSQDPSSNDERLIIDSRAQYEHVVKGSSFAPTVDVRGELVMNEGSITGARKLTGSHEGAVTVTGEDAKFTLNGGSVTDNQRKLGSASSTQYGAANVALYKGATMVMNGGEVSNGRTETSDAYGETGGIGVFDGAHLTVNGGKITDNHGWVGNINAFNWQQSVCSKEDTAATRARVDINGGEISNGSAAFGGGGINIFGNADVTMNGGTIKDNYASNGGGVNAMDLYVWGASGTWAEVAGDGKDCGFTPEEWTKVSPGSFTMNGGSITGNTSSRTGGGINVVSNGVHVNAGLIESNEARQQGGGVYIATKSYAAHFKDALITENEATSDRGVAFGGGIWLCPTGNLTMHVTNGAAVFENIASRERASGQWGDDIAHDNYGTASKAGVRLDSRMLGGGMPAYYKDGSYSSDRFDPENPGKKQVFDGTARDSDDSSDYRTSISNEGLKTVANAQAKDAARSWARLTISKNKAPRGGGIGSNGGVVFGTPGSTSVDVKKEWKDSDGGPLAAKSMVPVEVQLWGSVAGEKFPVGKPVTLNAANKWQHTFKDLPKTKTVDGEQVEIKYSVEEQGVASATATVEMSGSAKDGLTISAPAAVTPVKFQLMESTGGEKSPVGEPVELNADNDWTHTFKDLPATKEVEGKQVDITYSTKELGVSGFTFRITGDAKSGFTITNTPTQPPTTEVSVNKVWKSFDGLDLDSALMTPVKVQLMKTVAGEDSTVGEPVELNADNNWAHTFKDLPQFEIVDGKRNQVTYTVKERTIDGFSSKVTGTAKDGFVVSNTQTPPPTTAVDVTKVWEAFDGSQLDASETVPVKVQLLESTGGEKSPVGDPVELNAENGWKYSFTDLPQWKLVDGKKVDVTYSVEELTVEGFTSKVTGDAEKGFTITNTQTPPPVTSVDVTKVWKDAEGNALDADSTVPVKVQLLESTGGEKSPVGDPVELNAENGWKYSFKDLPQWKLVDGKKVDVTYSLEELTVEGFTSKVTGDAASGFTITNTQTPPPSTPPTSPTPPATPPTPPATPPAPPSTPPAQETPGKPHLPLPRTGVEVGAAAALALVFMGIGVVLIKRRKA